MKKVPIHKEKESVGEEKTLLSDFDSNSNRQSPPKKRAKITRKEQGQSDSPPSGSGAKIAPLPASVNALEISTALTPELKPFVHTAKENPLENESPASQITVSKAMIEELDGILQTLQNEKDLSADNENHRELLADLVTKTISLWHLSNNGTQGQSGLEQEAAKKLPKADEVEEAPFAFPSPPAAPILGPTNTEAAQALGSQKAADSICWGNLLSESCDLPHCELTGTMVNLGRSSKCQVSIKDPAVSNLACRISWCPTKLKATIECCTSSSHLYWNHTPMRKGQKGVIRSGDQIQITGTKSYAYVVEIFTLSRPSTLPVSRIDGARFLQKAEEAIAGWKASAGTMSSSNLETAPSIPDLDFTHRRSPRFVNADDAKSTTPTPSGVPQNDINALGYKLVNSKGNRPRKSGADQEPSKILRFAGKRARSEVSPIKAFGQPSEASNTKEGTKEKEEEEEEGGGENKSDSKPMYSSSQFSGQFLLTPKDLLNFNLGPTPDSAKAIPELKFRKKPPLQATTALPSNEPETQSSPKLTSEDIQAVLEQKQTIREAFAQLVKEPSEIDQSLEDFPDYISTSTRDRLLAMCTPFLRVSEVNGLSDVISALHMPRAGFNRSVMLMAPAGCDLYLQRAVSGLAKQLGVALLSLSPETLPAPLRSSSSTFPSSPPPSTVPSPRDSKSLNSFGSNKAQERDPMDTSQVTDSTSLAEPLDSEESTLNQELAELLSARETSTCEPAQLDRLAEIARSKPKKQSQADNFLVRAPLLRRTSSNFSVESQYDPPSQTEGPETEKNNDDAVPTTTPVLLPPPSGPPVKHFVLSEALVREGPDLDSREVGSLKAGTIATSAPVHPCFSNHPLVLAGRRFRIVAPIQGYASLYTADGTFLFEDVSLELSGNKRKRSATSEDISDGAALQPAQGKHRSFKVGDRVKYIGPLKPKGAGTSGAKGLRKIGPKTYTLSLSQFPGLFNQASDNLMGPQTGHRGKVVLTFSENSQKVGVRFDKPISGGNDLGGRCEVGNGYFCETSCLRLESDCSLDDCLEDAALDCLFEVAVGCDIPCAPLCKLDASSEKDSPASLETKDDSNTLLSPAEGLYEVAAAGGTKLYPDSFVQYDDACTPSFLLSDESSTENNTTLPHGTSVLVSKVITVENSRLFKVHRGELQGWIHEPLPASNDAVLQCLWRVSTVDTQEQDDALKQNRNASKEVEALMSPEILDSTQASEASEPATSETSENENQLVQVKQPVDAGSRAQSPTTETKKNFRPCIIFINGVDKVLCTQYERFAKFCKKVASLPATVPVVVIGAYVPGTKTSSGGHKWDRPSGGSSTTGLLVSKSMGSILDLGFLDNFRSAGEKKQLGIAELYSQNPRLYSQLTKVFPVVMEFLPPQDTRGQHDWQKMLARDAQALALAQNLTSLKQRLRNTGVALEGGDAAMDRLRLLKNSILSRTELDQWMGLSVSIELQKRFQDTKSMRLALEGQKADENEDKNGAQDKGRNQTQSLAEIKLSDSESAVTPSKMVTHKGLSSEVAESAIVLVDRQVGKELEDVQNAEKSRSGRSSSPLVISKASLLQAASLMSQAKAESENMDKSFENIATENEFEKRILQDAVIPPGETGVCFKDVQVDDVVKQTLIELVMLPLKRPELFRRGHLTAPCKGILLFGPPGTGKTMLAKAVATEAGAHFIYLTMSTIASKWFGEGEKYVKATFTLASKMAPTIIFIDEVDSMLGRREKNGEHEAMRKIKNEFMASWDGLRSNPLERVTVLGVTNRPFDLDDAVLRRFPRRMLVDMPDATLREKILKAVLSDEALSPNFDFGRLARDDVTGGFSGSDLKNMCIAAAYRPIREIITKESKHKKSPLKSSLSLQKMDASKNEVVYEEDLDEEEVELRNLHLADFEAAAKEIGASTSEDSFTMQEIRKWNEMYGERGSRKKTVLSYFT